MRGALRPVREVRPADIGGVRGGGDASRRKRAAPAKPARSHGLPEKI